VILFRQEKTGQSLEFMGKPVSIVFGRRPDNEMEMVVHQDKSKNYNPQS
jgi:hypothetical protein